MTKLYEIQIDEEGTFIDRPNRFIANIKLDDGSIVIAHVHDSGRIKEILYSGNRIKLRKATNLNRKTEWDVISGKGHDGVDVLINSSFHRYISENLLKDFDISPIGAINHLKAEVKYGNSRLDYLLTKNNQNIWIEIKGVSLTISKIAMFPDAPSKRATKHLKELIDLKEKGDRAAVILLVFRKSNSFRPKYETDPIFCEYFYRAIEKGVEIYPVQLSFKNGIINYHGIIKIENDIQHIENNQNSKNKEVNKNGEF